MTDTPAPDSVPTNAPGLRLDPGAGDPLLALRDIHLPQAVSFWPPAPGWWGLLAIILLAALLAAILEWRRRQTLAYRAMRELEAIAKDTARYQDSRAVGAAAALLVRRILVTRAHSPAAAVLTGDDWQSFLGKGKAGLPDDISRFLAAAPYLPPTAPAARAMERDRLVRALKRWIRGNA
ncbi:hypothetical protein GCM10007301_11090 [Azorhizobium oxalatiphilum]|uniref:DUF4381 domain-containing protein n=1 Tax=Azorhizobium oxalatiphilum TaxID=980631 RepID=A0A917BRL0_9HYPH|nr:DUF4381 domain-containing protein [Azorhizobium oxalatiphilum]GGF53422.1 hypothetical protein GCM10007301_11090 [Azorhizobium oxalatiphilum]